jgi:DNA-binding transcriptional LysR family regulator
MQLEALKVFCDLVNLRSFSKAAKANGKSQPAVSRIVHELEERLGVQLIDRSRRSLPLTSLGQVYYEGCKEFLEKYLKLEGSIRQARVRDRLAVTVRVAAIYSVGLGDIRDYVARFQELLPHARAQLDFLHPNQVYERVLEGTADLGLVSYPRRTRELAVLPWREEEMIVACAPSHPLAGSSAVEPARLDGQRFVGFDRGLVIRREVDRFLRHHGVSVDVGLEFDNIENIKRAIEIGAGLALLPRPMLAREVQAGTLRALPLRGCELVRPLGIIHRRHHPPGPAALAFIDLLRAEATGRLNGSVNGHPQPGSSRARGKGKVS